MHNEIFADGIGEITVSGTTVRLDFVSLSPTERDQNNAPKPVFRQRMIMSVEGFANSAELMQKALQGLIDGGAVKRTPVAHQHGTPGEHVPIRAEPGMSAGQNGSPNFS